MKARDKTWRLAALVAAYVIALQALALPFAVMAQGNLAVPLCSSALAGGSGGGPLDHRPICPCAAACGLPCCSHTGPVSAPQESASVVQAVKPVIFAAHRTEAPRQTPSFALHTPRGPPSA
ncbi:MAG TPA: hypothetical protein VFL51_02005 [Pseudolabrys sp.]|nr:hypothetical protein [Pseudolabrys sp.]